MPFEEVAFAASLRLGISLVAAFIPVRNLSEAFCPARFATLRLSRARHYAFGDTLIRPRVLLADDHRALLEAEIALLSPYFDVVGAAPDGAELVSAARRLLPDVIVTDITMPILNGVDAVYKLRRSGCTAIFVFLTMHSEGEFVEACMEAGALGYVQKSSMKRHLVPAIQAVLAGQSYVSQSDSTK